MFRLLYLLFRKQFNRVIYSQQSKPQDKSSMIIAFIDSDGRRYYKWNDEMEMPLMRWAKLQVFFGELTMCMNSKELLSICDGIEKAMNADTRDLAMVGFLVKEMRNRTTLLLHEEILFRIVTALYVREDEQAGKWDADIEEQKIEQFRKDSREGLYDFFYNAGIGKFVPYWEKCKGDLETLLEMSLTKVKAMERLLGAYSSANGSVKELLKGTTS